MSKNQTNSEKTMVSGLYYVGVDVSKDTLDVYHEILCDSNSKKAQKQGNHQVIRNSFEAIEGYYSALLAQYPMIKVQFIFEATGTYSDVLKHSLFGLCVPFSVISPEKSHSFMMSENMTNITDKQCAKMLCLFGKQKTPPVYQMPTEAEMHLKQLVSALDDLKKDLRRFENQQHAQAQLVNCDTQILTIWDAKVAQSKIDIETIEQHIQKLSNTHFEEMITNIQTIPGVGKATATAIVIATQGFASCNSAKSLAKFIGLCPTQADSGSSVRKAKHIPKSGIAAIKSLLFNCARSALRCNTTTKDFFDKLVKNGKNGKVALTALMHKLLRIIYAVATSGLKFDPNFAHAKNI